MCKNICKGSIERQLNHSNLCHWPDEWRQQIGSIHHPERWQTLPCAAPHWPGRLQTAPVGRQTPCCSPWWRHGLFSPSRGKPGRGCCSDEPRGEEEELRSLFLCLSVGYNAHCPVSLSHNVVDRRGMHMNAAVVLGHEAKLVGFWLHLHCSFASHLVIPLRSSYLGCTDGGGV